MPPASFPKTKASIPAAAGIGLRGPHQLEFLQTRPKTEWLEAHSENYFAEDGVAVETLERIREYYPLSLHGVGLSLGSTDPLDRVHLKKLDRLIRRVEPGLVSEHLSWGSVDRQHLNDLLPLPYTEEAVGHVCTKIKQTQDYLQRRILIENVSGYFEFSSSTMPEWEFLNAVAEASGAGILLDINNVYVNAENHGFSAIHYIESIHVPLVSEIHLAGHSMQGFGNEQILVDTHDRQVCEAVWDLFESAILRIGAVPTLIEWDSDLPSLSILLDEAGKAQRILDKADVRAA